MVEFNELKTEGNNYFKSEDYNKALSCYIKALDLNTISDFEREVLFKNQSQCYLKLGKYDHAVDCATKALELSPNDPKALYRRCQAYEKLGRIQEAHADAVKMFKQDSSNTAIHPILKRLEMQVKKLQIEKDSLLGRINSMFKLLKDPATPTDTVKTALNNLSALIKDDHAGDKIWNHADFSVIYDKCRSQQDAQIVDSANRVVGLIIRDDKLKGLKAFETFSHEHIISLLQSHDDLLVKSGARLVQVLITSMSDLTAYQQARDRHEALKRTPGMKPPRFTPYEMPKETKAVIDEGLKILVKMINSRKLSAVGRDCVLETLVKFIGKHDGLGWQLSFMENGGVEKVLDLGSVIAEDSKLKVSDDVKLTGAILLSKVYDDLANDKQREQFRSICNNFINDLLSDDLLETKVQAASVIGMLYQGVMEAASEVMARDGLMEGLIMLAKSDVTAYQKIALDTIIVASQKKARSSAVASIAAPILQELYKSGKDAIQLRALVGLCKFGSIGGSDPSQQTFADGSNQVLAKSCRKYLLTGDKDICHWAVEGLVYLSLDAEVKEDLTYDEAVVKAMFNLSKISTESLFALAGIIVHLVNGYDKPDILPEMKDLAKFSKQHVPEEHAKDQPDYVEKRIKKLVELGLPSCLYQMSLGAEKLATNNTKELISRIYLAISNDVSHRGAIVQAGGGKALINLSLKNSESGKVLAAQALAKIAITANPRVAFPGQRSLEVARPLLQLLHVERSGLQNFEALLALTNLASVDDYHRNRILKDDGFASIEHYIYEEHEDLRRAATECICNLAVHDSMPERFAGENDRVKLLLFYSVQTEDIRLAIAASGTLAYLTRSPDVCKKITQINNWMELIQSLVSHENESIQHRGAHILADMFESSQELAEYLVGTNMLEVLMALSKMDDPKRQKSKECAERALERCCEYKLIQPKN